MRRWWTRHPLLLGYALLLVASHAVRAVRDAPAPEPGERVARLREVDGSARGERRVPVVWRESGPAGGGSPHVDAGRAPALLLHGSPGGKDDLASIGRVLAAGRRVVRPDLPGFGASERDVPDYSVAAHADYVLQLLDELGIERVHLVGFSMGGGVALVVCDRAPGRVASLTLISSIGVQELELLGERGLNRALHGLQLGGLWAVHELVPHFGLLDRSFLSVEYARNFYDTDQRGLRGALERWDGPALIVHGKGDVLVPFAAAREHHRILPQSELAALEGNHFLVFRRGEELGARIADFLAAVDAGRATTRATADPARRAAAAERFDVAALEPLAGFALAIVLLLIAAGTLVSEDLACIGAGVLVGHGRLDFLPGVAACFLGIYVGDVLLFLAGRVIGRPALGRAPLRWFLSEERVARCSAWLDRRGPFVIFFSRFLPGLRLPTYFASGVLRTSFWRFSLWFALAAALWTPLVVWLSAELGAALGRIDALRESLGRVLVAALLAGGVLVTLVRPALSHRGRRLLVSRWRRLVRWEFWPPWVFYPPVVLACLWTALRTRRPLAFTAANPGIPHGGFVGESKAAILRGLSASAERLPATELVPATLAPDARVDAARAFLRRHGLALPVVLKPDVGQRGDAVRIVRSDDELESALRAAEEDLLLQEYVAGEEFGLFYARRPDEPRGRILSITEKHLPFVVGDGRRTLEELVLDDPRAVCMAGFYLDQNAARLAEVPAERERVAIGELGTHCRGAVFLDGAAHGTPELEAAVDEVARSFDGFHFGRFDVRAASAAELAAGSFRILELNGVTSEAAHVYDPRYSVLDGWRTIAAQWRLAYEIGAANAARGARTSSAGELLRAVLAYRQRARRRRARARRGSAAKEREA